MLILMPGNQPKKKNHHPFDIHDGGYTYNKSQNYNFLIKKAFFSRFYLYLKNSIKKNTQQCYLQVNRKAF